MEKIIENERVISYLVKNEEILYNLIEFNRFSWIRKNK